MYKAVYSRSEKAAVEARAKIQEIQEFLRIIEKLEAPPMIMPDELWMQTAIDAEKSFKAACDSSSEWRQDVSKAITLLKLYIAAAGKGHGRMPEAHDLLRTYIAAAAALNASRTGPSDKLNHLKVIVERVRVLSGAPDSRCLENLCKALMDIGRARTDLSRVSKDFQQECQLFQGLERALLKYIKDNLGKN